MTSASKLHLPGLQVVNVGDRHILISYSMAFIISDRLSETIKIWLKNDQILATLLELNAGAIIALYAIYVLIERGGEAIRLNRRDRFAIASCCLFLIPPIANFPFIGSTIVAIYFITRRPHNLTLQWLGQLWLAISFYEVWGKLLFKIFFAPFVELEAFIISRLGELMGLGLAPDGILLTAPNGWSVYIAEPCSSFHNISLTFVIWLSIVRLAASEPGKNIRSLVASIVAVISLNAGRILLMATSEPEYRYWHDGGGSIIFSTVTLLTVSTLTTLLLPPPTSCKAIAGPSSS